MELRFIASLRGGYRQDQDSGVFVSFCPALKIYSQGRNAEEAMEALRSAVKLFLNNCYKREQLERALRELGFTETASLGTASPEQYKAEFVAIERAHYDEFQFDVPLHLVAQERSECQP